MKGAIIGDIIGSRFEKNNIKTKDFELFSKECRFTDDSVLTVAIAHSILTGNSYEKAARRFGRRYPFVGYGKSFKKWLIGFRRGPYNSWGNGSAMRVSPIGHAFSNENEVLEEAKKSAMITHNHEEGVKGAQALAMAVFLSKIGKSKKEIKDYIEQKFHYNLNRKIEEIRPNYTFDISCQGSVPEAIIAFIESENFEDAIRTAISIGGDSDTIASMTGAISEAYYKSIPKEIESKMNEYIPNKFKKIIKDFENKYNFQ